MIHFQKARGRLSKCCLSGKCPPQVHVFEHWPPANDNFGEDYGNLKRWRLTGEGGQSLGEDLPVL